MLLWAASASRVRQYRLAHTSRPVPRQHALSRGAASRLTPEPASSSQQLLRSPCHSAPPALTLSCQPGQCKSPWDSPSQASSRPSVCRLDLSRRWRWHWRLQPAGKDTEAQRPMSRLQRVVHSAEVPAKRGHLSCRVIWVLFCALSATTSAWACINATSAAYPQGSALGDARMGWIRAHPTRLGFERTGGGHANSKTISLGGSECGGGSGAP